MAKWNPFKDKEKAIEALNESVRAFYVLAILLFFFGFALLFIPAYSFAAGAFIEALCFSLLPYATQKWKSVKSALILLVLILFTLGISIYQFFLKQTGLVASVFSLILFLLALRLFFAVLRVAERDTIGKWQAE